MIGVNNIVFDHLHLKIKTTDLVIDYNMYKLCKWVWNEYSIDSGLVESWPNVEYLINTSIERHEILGRVESGRHVATDKLFSSPKTIWLLLMCVYLNYLSLFKVFFFFFQTKWSYSDGNNDFTAIKWHLSNRAFKGEQK